MKQPGEPRELEIRRKEHRFIFKYQVGQEGHLIEALEQAVLDKRTFFDCIDAGVIANNVTGIDRMTAIGYFRRIANGTYQSNPSLLLDKGYID